MRWPWKRPAVEHRSSYTDAVVTAILQSASGGGVRTALATAALETVATLYASALSSCARSRGRRVSRGRSMRPGGRLTASELIRQRPSASTSSARIRSAGLALGPCSHWDVIGGPRPSSWFYRVELAGPSGTAWRNAERWRSVLHHPLVDRPRAPMGGCQSVTARGRYRQSRGVDRQAT